MTESQTRMLRIAALIVSGAGVLFWLYTFYGIAQVPKGDGTGMQWVAVMPLGVIFFALTLPSLILALKNKSLWLSLALGVIGLAVFALLWRQLLSEFHHGA